MIKFSEHFEKLLRYALAKGVQEQHGQPLFPIYSFHLKNIPSFLISLNDQCGLGFVSFDLLFNHNTNPLDIVYFLTGQAIDEQLTNVLTECGFSNYFIASFASEARIVGPGDVQKAVIDPATTKIALNFAPAREIGGNDVHTLETDGVAILNQLLFTHA